jgi:hypothetical protein
LTCLATGRSAPVELNHAATCLSGRPLHRLGRGGRAEDGGLEPQRSGRPAGFKPVAASLAASSSLRKVEALIPSGCPPSPLRTGARTGRVRFPWRKTEVLIPRRFPVPPGFRPEAAAWRLRLPRRRADYSKATPFDAHPLATEPGTPVRFTLPACGCVRTDPGTRTLNICGLSAAPLPIGLDRLGADDRPRTGDLHLGKVTRCQLRYIRVEPFPGADPGDPSIPRTRARRREGHELRGWPPRSRTWKSPGPKPGGSADSPSGHREPPAGVEPAAVPLQRGRSGLLSYRGGIICAAVCAG